MTTMQFTVTNAGKNAAWNANNTGTSINITHIQLGSGNRVPAATDTALVTPQQAATVAAGFKVSPTQIRMSAMFTGALAYNVNEVGLWLGNPASGGVLFGYWSQASGTAAVKSANIDFIFTHDMILDAAIPPGSVTVTVDTAQAALIANHEAAANPHPQYQKAALLCAPSVQKITWTDLIDVATATYSSAPAVVKSFTFTAPALSRVATIMMSTPIHSMSNGYSSDWLLFLNGVEIGYLHCNATNNDDTIFHVVFNVPVLITAGTIYTLDLKAQVYSTAGNMYTNHGQAPGQGAHGKSEINILFQ